MQHVYVAEEIYCLTLNSRLLKARCQLGYTGVVTQLDRTTVYYSRERERIQLEVYVTMKKSFGIVSV